MTGSGRWGDPTAQVYRPDIVVRIEATGRRATIRQ